jgi:hypothetical protein
VKVCLSCLWVSRNLDKEHPESGRDIIGDGLK